MTVAIGALLYLGFALLVGRFCSMNSRWERAVSGLLDETTPGLALSAEYALAAAAPPAPGAAVTSASGAAVTPASAAAARTGAVRAKGRAAPAAAQVEEEQLEEALC